MRTAAQCRQMAGRLDDYAERESDPRMCIEWASLALHWRDLARQAEWQDRYEAGSP